MPRTSRHPAPRLRPTLDDLERRALLSSLGTIEPTAEEQYMLQLINRARREPQAEVQRLLEQTRNDPAVREMSRDWDLGRFSSLLSAITPQPPLAFNTRLIAAARDQNQTMLRQNDQRHSPTGYLTDARVATAADGQPYYAPGPGAWSAGENVYAFSRNVIAPDLAGYVDYFHAGLMIDWGVPDFGHMYNLMAPGPGTAAGTGRRPYTEIGIGLLTDARPTTPRPANPVIAANRGLDVGPVILTQEFGYRSGPVSLTGAIYEDRDRDRFYTPGEGLDDVLIRATGLAGQGTFEMLTWASGGYSLPLPAGTYQVTATARGQTLGATAVTVSRDNVGWDLVASTSPGLETPVPADFDGDHRADLATFRNDTGQWFVPGRAPDQWGLPGDVPVAGDYDGDGRADLAVWRPSNGCWYVKLATGAVQQYGDWWGLPGDVPVAGDYDGDGRADLAVWRPSNGCWYVKLATGTVQQYGDWWGLPGDVPVAGDYDGDGRADQAVFRATGGRGTWYIQYSRGGVLHDATAGWWGLEGDRPAPADYDGDGRTDLGVFRPGDGPFHARQAPLTAAVPAAPRPAEAAVAQPIGQARRIAAVRPRATRWASRVRA